MVLLTAVVGLVVGVAPAANAAYYNTYADVASTPDAYSCTGAQGFAAGATYLYSIKVRSDNGRAVIYRATKSGSRTVMTNGADGTKYVSGLGHANDMTIVDIDGAHHFFIVTMASSGAQLVKLRYDGTTYRKVGAYNVRLGTALKAVSGVSRVSVTADRINFFFKSGARVYRGSLPLRANTGSISITKAFDLKVSGALVNGSTVSDLTTFANQGFFYDAARKTLYYPLTKANRSIVLVYRNVAWATSGTLTSDRNLSFRITSSTYSKFEIESLGISSDGRLWFSTNRSNSSGAYDGVHYFKGYSVL